MNTFDAFYLPGFDMSTVREWRYVEHDGMRSRYPVLGASQLIGICASIRSRRNAQLVDIAVRHVVEAVSAAAERMHNSLDEITRLVSAITGYSAPVTAQTLQQMFADWQTDSLQAMLRAELGNERVLDQAIEDPNMRGKRIAAYGFPLTFHVFSGNVPGVAVTSIIRALLVKSAVLGKTASGEPALAVIFARELEHVAPEIAECLAVSYWPGDEAGLSKAAAAEADAVIVYGGEVAVSSVARGLAPGKRLVVHGPRVSFGVVGPRRNEQIANEVAHAVAAYDQQGCVSPHLVYVAGTAEEAERFAQAVAVQLERLAESHPRGRLSTEEAVAIRNARAQAEFGDGEVFGAEHSGYSVIFEPDPAFRLSCLNRVVYVKPVASAHDVALLLPASHHLQSAAVAGFDDTKKAELIRLLGLAGVSRITSFERLPWPPMHWHHDGSAPLRELLWWQDIES